MGRALVKELIQIIKEALAEAHYNVEPSASDTEIICFKGNESTVQKFIIDVRKMGTK